MTTFDSTPNPGEFMRCAMTGLVNTAACSGNAAAALGIDPILGQAAGSARFSSDP
jgi:hypothetical protein